MDKIPGCVSDKLGDLVEIRDQLRSYAGAAMSRAETDRMKLGGIKQALQSSRGTGMAVIGGASSFGPSPEQLAEVHREIGELEQKIQASVDEFAKRRTYADSADAILTTCRDWLLRLPETTKLEPVPIAIANGDSRKMLDLVRRDLAEAQARLGVVRSSPPPLAELETKLADWVRARGNSQRVQVRAPRGQPLEISWHSSVVSPFGPSSGSPEASALTLACRLNPEGVLALLLQEYGRSPTAAQEGMTDDEHDAEVSKLTAQIDQLGRSEEALVSKLLRDQPTAVTRRTDADPQHVLACRIVTKSGRALRAVA